MTNRSDRLNDQTGMSAGNLFRGTANLCEYGSSSKPALKDRSAQGIPRTIWRRFEQLMKSRSEQMEQDLGRYYVVDTYRNAVTNTCIDLETPGRELEVLRPWEASEVQE